MPNALINFRREAFQNQNGRCFYCGSLMWTKDVKGFARSHGISEIEAARFQCTAEHLTARCDGGRTSRDNIVAACRFCNIKRHRRKNPLAPDIYRAYIKKRYKKGKWHPKKLRNAVSM